MPTTATDAIAQTANAGWSQARSGLVLVKLIEATPAFAIRTYAAQAIPAAIGPTNVTLKVPQSSAIFQDPSHSIPLLVADIAAAASKATNCATTTPGLPSQAKNRDLNGRP
ncbi:hypothetical protein NSI01_29980 [Pimelobacter simplex]|nr:hypothetical protein NSI01_29980 [Pimelobacter simplex]